MAPGSLTVLDDEQQEAVSLTWDTTSLPNPGTFAATSSASPCDSAVQRDFKSPGSLITFQTVCGMESHLWATGHEND